MANLKVTIKESPEWSPFRARYKVTIVKDGTPTVVILIRENALRVASIYMGRVERALLQYSTLKDPIPSVEIEINDHLMFEGAPQEKR